MSRPRRPLKISGRCYRQVWASGAQEARTAQGLETAAESLNESIAAALLENPAVSPRSSQIDVGRVALKVAESALAPTSRSRRSFARNMTPSLAFPDRVSTRRRR